ncbi:NYN domain-containing protein [Corynebacterium poyangense]|uniref:NYN domain-containing protein n=1 Tax=Corynebacterium poyangense TaxID=2684405 RepID=A0A7H0SRM0_9CORY|nr:NYN domain-containing protein [Corynebacterium poyangense]MBZ8176626.1 NYN domain-containing protein [Corynebacterium poyangense]QNQ91195.1 NYN domain-containing protein [Corynebacterium poyangense]
MSSYDDPRLPHLGGPSHPEENTLLLVWDAPNLDMGLGALLGGRPSSQQRPRFDAVGRWLVEESQRMSEEIVPEATVFTNVYLDGAEVIRPWVEALRNVGFAVFAKPKLTEESDVDPDMIDHIRRRHAEGVLRGLVVASADGQNFRELLEELAEEGLPVTVLGFHEHASWAVASDLLRFIDLEDIPQVFREPLPRINLDQLPDSGAWLQPFRPLTALEHQRDQL